MGCVFCTGIKVRECLVCQLGQTLIFLMFCDLVCQQNAVELGPRSLAALGFHVVAAVVNSQRHVRKDTAHILGRYPIRRIIGVIVVAVLAQTIGGLEVGCVSVVVLELSHHVVPPCGIAKSIHIGDLNRIRVAAVALHAGTVGTVERECLRHD